MRTVNPEIIAPLRRQAEALLKAGTAPKAKVGATGAEALALLYNMASTPANSSAALKFLHELQVHQVELDLQHEQLELSREDQTRALDRYVERFDFAPVGYLAVDLKGKIIEGNRMAAELFGIEQAVLSGRHIDSLVAPQSRLTLRALLKRLGNGGSKETCAAQVADGAGVPRNFQVVATVSPGAPSFLMVWVETTDHSPPDPRS